MGMQDVRTAADLRRVIEKIVNKTIDRKRPALRTGRVFSFNVGTQIAQVLFPGNTSLVPCRFALDKIPTSSIEDNLDTGTDISNLDFSTLSGTTYGDVVRVAGKPGDWFILDFVSGSPASSPTPLNEDSGGTGANFYEDSIVVTGTGNQIVPLTYVPIDDSLHLYWEGIFQQEDNWTRDYKDVTVSDPDLYIEVGDYLECKYAYLDAEQLEPAPVPASILLVGSTVVLSPGINTTTTALPLPAGTQAGDLLVVSLSCAQFSDLPTCLDSRMIETHNLVASVGNAKGGLVGYGFEDGSGTDVTVHVTAAANNRQSIVTAYRITGAIAGTLWHHEGFITTVGPFCNPPMPPVDPDDMAIVALSNLNAPAEDTGVGWTRDAGTTHSGGTAQAGTFYKTNGITVPHFHSGTSTEITEWMSLAIAIGPG